ncbi:unknown in ISEc8 [Janthinobacterium sp. CG23_2]|nr:IS66 family insertion sequence element accessory protein TnpB [Massilia sp. H27-R4]MCY0913339.1 IS66 family insertion sequence element accessory protein TnpB [Massilia sp. H27-R4]CUI09460.1 unknown in ISEc8 [Janthinobacterium sp. CG23_2]CUU33246.1 unknown in ISEc8 [Janthinobacterium sp. CG23_2]
MQIAADAIWLATAAVDMRTGIDGLSLHVQQALGRPPCDGTAYVFANRRRTRLKLVCWDGTASGCACAVCTVTSSCGPNLAIRAGR